MGVVASLVGICGMRLNLCEIGDLRLLNVFLFGHMYLLGHDES